MTFLLDHFEQVPKNVELIILSIFKCV